MCLLWTHLYFRSRPQLLIDATPDTKIPSQSNEKWYSSADALLTCLCIYPLKKCVMRYLVYLLTGNSRTYFANFAKTGR